MQNKGNNLRQQLKDMKQFLKLKISAGYKQIRDEGAWNLAAALTEMPQLMVLEVWID